MRAFADPFGPTPEEALEASLAWFELHELGERARLRMPSHLREGLEAGRLRRFRGIGLRRTHQRLALRHLYRTGPGARSEFTGHYVVLRCIETRQIVRLPYA